ncbi:NADPH-dependent F420 reductase [Trueperella pecoris]|uniref:NADPH-dependent F420 reductase n=1 Tax=Trueperella pecoris TaxID=2733571 RepID=UPI00186B874C|nr:NAD(P)-binding domain-containing protein [Trueperella pecoris]QOQ39510.1 NADP oxidoreductase [Trueperella pecoris]
MEHPPFGAVIVGAGQMGTALAERFDAINTTALVLTREHRLPTNSGAHATIDASKLFAIPLDVPVFLAIPLSAIETLPAESLTGRVVVDVANYWPRLDASTRFANSPRDSSLVVQSLFPGARVVKTLNHLSFADLTFDFRPRHADYRRGQCVAGDDAVARLATARIVDALGFTPVDAGPLANGRMFGPGTQIFNGGWRTAEQLVRILRRRTDYPAATFDLG